MCLWAGLAGSDALSQRPLYTATQEGTLGTILGLRDRHVQRGKSRINDGSAAPSAHRVPETLARCPCLPTCSQLPKTEASVGGHSVASQERSAPLLESPPKNTRPLRECSHIPPPRSSLSRGERASLSRGELPGVLPRDMRRTKSASKSGGGSGGSPRRRLGTNGLRELRWLMEELESGTSTLAV